MHMRWSLLGCFAMLLVAGCATPQDDGAADRDGQITVDPDRPDTQFTDVVTGPAVGPDLNATTAAAPRLVEGEWWRIAFSSDFYAGTSEVVRVVANATPEGYIFGMPHEGWYKEAIAYHAPAFGDVGLDLSYATHNEVFQPVKFPLTAGATWETTFATAGLRATVEEADEHTATIRFDSTAEPDPAAPVTNLAGLTSEGPFMRLEYDARQHEIVSMESFIGKWEVVEHGYGFEGWVTVPRGEHTAIDYGTFWAMEGSQPMSSREIEVSGGFNRMTLMHVVVPLSPGAYKIASTAPGGTEFVTEADGREGSVAIAFYEVADPDGTWTAEDQALGVGATYSMGIAYHQYDIRLPDQARRTDHSHAVIR